MSGDSTFGNSNIAAASSLSDPDEREEKGLEKLQESSQYSTNSELDQTANAEWQKSNAAIVAKVLSNFGDSVNGALPVSPEKRSSRWRQKLSTQGKDAAQKAKQAEQHFNLTDDSIDAAEQKFKNRRRPFTRNQNQKDREEKWREAAAAALNDTNESRGISVEIG
ncbi:hypothetical protein LSTR_LSTR001748 [Laodelphax striatellus]|uniref:Uncharacterized protein n=1 Tax=Laodelphax striatellus TaxID=195883 RepID=A0A482XCR6_LAOST|nr:hypothetical protein LSTR_LSTR001748 [Laodelphax striatellus]